MGGISPGQDGPARSYGAAIFDGVALVGLLFGGGAFAQEAAVAAGAETAAIETEAPGEGTLVLDTLEITAAPGTTTEDTGSWTTEWMRSATGMPLSQKETPQSTSVITDAQMKDRNITSVDETLAAATGITVLPYDSERSIFHARGFEITAYQYDGVPIPRDSTWQFGDNNADMVLYDHVEIVRGATGLMQGAGEPGASINFVRKRPTSFLRREVAAALAYPTGGRAEVDISGPLNESGTVRGRLIGAADARESSLDRYFKERYTGFGALEFDLTDSTLLNVGISYQDTRANNVSWAGLPAWYADGSLIDWPRGFNLGADWTKNDTQRTEAYASLEHVFDNGWTGRVVATHVRNDMQAKLLWVTDGLTADGEPIFVDPATGVGPVADSAGNYDGGYTQNSLNAVVNGDFEALGRTHQFVVGLFGSKGDGDFDGYSADDATLGPVGNIFAWDGSFAEPSWSPTVDQNWASNTTQVGLYGTTQFHATDALAIIGGARLNYWDGSVSDTYTGEASYSYRNIVTPYLGVTYDINQTFTAYGSVTSIYQPNLLQDANGDFLGPTYGWNYEVGVKAGLFDGAMYASAALFRTDQKDVAEFVDQYTDPSGRVHNVYRSIDGTTTQGFELEAAGAINERWNASFGYTYATSEDNAGNEVNTDTPRNTLKAATDYRVPGFLDERLTLGGAVRWQSATDGIPWYDDLPNVKQDPYAVFDLNASYDVTEESVLTLSVNNILDEKYYASTGFYNAVTYGDGISAELMLRARF